MKLKYSVATREFSKYNDIITFKLNTTTRLSKWSIIVLHIDVTNRYHIIKKMY